MPIIRVLQRGYAYGKDRVQVPVRFQAPAGPFTVKAILDTGAWISVFDHAMTNTIGITDVASGEAVDLVAADGKKERGYKHILTIGVLDRTLTLPIAFCPAWPKGMPNLLGMQGFFEQICIAFEHRLRKIYV